MTLRKHVYEYKRIVLGSGLRALLYSCLNQVPIVLHNIKVPNRIDFFKPTSDLNLIGLQNEVTKLHGIKIVEEVGTSKELAWQKLNFLASLSGLNLLADKTKSVRVQDDLLRITTQRERLIKIKFGELIVFDPVGVYGIEKNIEHKKLRVIDWFNVNSGAKHKFDILKDDDDFVNSIYFYKSDRICGNTQNLKDLVATSYCTKDELQNIEYSDLYARYIVLDMMKNAGIKGTKNGSGSFLSPKVTHTKRTVDSVYHFESGRENNIVFDNRAEEQILSEHNVDENSYLWKLAQIT